MKQIQRVYQGSPKPFGEVVCGLSGLSTDDVALIIRMGGAYVGKYRCKEPERVVYKGDLVAVYYRLPLKMDPISFDPAWLVHQDRDVIIAAKPKGLPTQGRRDADYMAFYELLKTHMNAYVGLHHRLDQDTSGLLLFSRRREVNKDMGALFQNQRIEKTYLAVVEGWSCEDDRLVLDGPIAVRREGRSQRRVVARDGQQALTHVRRLAEAEGLALVEAKPKTGRTHQIRVHLTHAGMPLVGDTFYGGKPSEAGFLLHCARLNWPKTGRLAAGDVRIGPPQAWSKLLPPALLGAVALFKEGEEGA